MFGCFRVYLFENDYVCMDSGVINFVTCFYRLGYKIDTWLLGQKIGKINSR